MLLDGVVAGPAKSVQPPPAAGLYHARYSPPFGTLTFDGSTNVKPGHDGNDNVAPVVIVTKTSGVIADAPIDSGSRCADETAMPIGLFEVRLSVV